MCKELSIIIAHYKPNSSIENPLNKTLSIIKEQKSNFKIEIIIADDGSDYTSNIANNYSKKDKIKNDLRSIYFLENEKLKKMLKKNNILSDNIQRWVYLPKEEKCMSKARVSNFAANSANSNNLVFIDDDNYFISKNSIKNLLNLFKNYNFIVGQIKDKNGKLRKYSSNRVQGTTIALDKRVFIEIGGFGEWTEKFSCGVDSDFWIKIFKYFNKNKNLKACYTNEVSTYDSYSKRWKKYTKIFKEILLKIEFKKIHNCKNYKKAKYNLSRNKSLWIKDLTNKNSILK